MQKSTMNVVKGVSAGLMTGMAVGYVGKKMMDKNGKQIKKRASKAVQTMENILDTAQYMLK